MEWEGVFQTVLLFIASRTLTVQSSSFEQSHQDHTHYLTEFACQASLSLVAFARH